MDDLISRQAAIDTIVNTVSEIGLHDNSEVARYGATFRQHEIIDIIEALPSAQPELSHTQKSCEYCHEDSDGYVKPIEKNCHAYVNRGFMGWHIVLKARGWIGEAKIDFCPMCGRELSL